MRSTVALAALLTACTSSRPEAETRAPDFPSQATERWLGGSPTKLAALGGKVLLVEVWNRH